MFGVEELLLIFVIILFLFGADKLPELAKSLGSTMGEFKRAQREAEINMRGLSDFDKPEYRKSAIKSKVQETAEKLGINIVGKTDDQLLDEIQNLADKPVVEKN